MKEVYIAYFDFMGFSNFIENNENKIITRRIGNILSDLERCLSKNNRYENDWKLYADLSNIKLNCLNISDTILVWTNDCELVSLNNLIEFVYEFNISQNQYNFPLRGVVVKGEVNLISGVDNSYSVQCLYGKGVVYAHKRAESQNWAGTFVDELVIKDLKLKDNSSIINNFFTEYNVPFKNGYKKEFVFKISENKLDKNQLLSKLENVDIVFSFDNKQINTIDVKTKIENTKRFILETCSKNSF